MKKEDEKTNPAIELARKLKELRDRRNSALEKIEELRKEIDGLDAQLDRMLESVVCCV
ncbi:MAG: hypothetical protein AB1640_19845 [bacterium]